MHLTRGLKAAGKESGQIVVILALLLPLLMLFTGFAIDFGFAFLAKAELAKGCDGANLETMLNYGLGPTKAKAVGQSVFALNYKGDPIFNASPPTASFTFSTDGSGNPICSCTATAKIHTFFIRLMGISTLNVSDVSQATRPPVILSLVLDRTGSMNGNGGAAALPGAVSDFDQYFIQGTDELGQVSFAWSGTNDVPMTKTFIAPIDASVNRMTFTDGTYSMSGLQDGYTQITGVVSPPANTVKVVVFFTDGWDNTIQASLPSPTASNKVLVEFGGDAATTGFDEGDYLTFIDPNNVGLNNGQGNGNGFYGANASPNTTVTCEDGGNGFRPYSSMQYCNGAKKFTPILGSADPLGASPVSINRINITQDAEYSTIQFAETMRAQGITVYSIGLGNDIDQTYLQEIANDPASPTYNASEPTGLALFAPRATDLNSAFQTVAEKILLRLTQ